MKKLSFLVTVKVCDAADPSLVREHVQHAIEDYGGMYRRTFPHDPPPRVKVKDFHRNGESHER